MDRAWSRRRAPRPHPTPTREILVGMRLMVCVIVGSLAACGDGGATPADRDAGPTCTSDPLRTGITTTQTGVSADAYDCEILNWTAADGEPDPMIIKAIIYVESRFDRSSV